ncbi:histidine kinase [Streptomyces sp. B8F3]|uniref:histidine kinase n=1 Tax=Streptomyces sp. B8F3 TaxID=3153573 RepID=UPI00325E4121
MPHGAAVDLFALAGGPGVGPAAVCAGCWRWSRRRARWCGGGGRLRVPAVVLLLDGGAEALVPEAAVVPALPGAVWVALFSLAVHGGVRDALAGAAVATAVVGAPMADASSAWALLDELPAGASLHLLLVLCGRLRRHRVARRARVAARRAGAAREQDAAAAAERERLTRELHDAAGHHLSAVAVQSAAALRLVDSRPELAGEALAGAAATGRTAATLARLVDAAGDEAGQGPLDRRLAALCGRLADLGFPVALAVTGRVLILTTYRRDDYVFEALRAGASGFLPKACFPQDLVDVIRTVAAGEALLAPAVVRGLIEAFMTGWTR